MMLRETEQPRERYGLRLDQGRSLLSREVGGGTDGVTKGHGAEDQHVSVEYSTHLRSLSAAKWRY